MQATPLGVVLVTGFLGAGKSTLVKRIVEELRGAGPCEAQVHVLVNDFAPLNVDAAALEVHRRDDAVFEEFTDGCICCTLLPKLLSTIENIAQEQSLLSTEATKPPSRPQWAVVESTGIGEAGPILAGLSSLPACASGRVVVCSSIVVVDVIATARRLSSNDETVALLAEQTQWATHVVLTRCAESTSEDRRAVADLIRRNWSEASRAWCLVRGGVFPGDHGTADLDAILNGGCPGPLSLAKPMAAVDLKQCATLFELHCGGAEHQSEAERFGFKSCVVGAGDEVVFELDKLLKAAAADGGLLDGVARSKGYIAVTRGGCDGAAFQYQWSSCGRVLEVAPVEAPRESWVRVPGSKLQAKMAKSIVWIGRGGSGDVSATTHIVFIGRHLAVDRLIAALEALMVVAVDDTPR